MKEKVGRPKRITPEILIKLREYFSYGCSDREACTLCMIGESTLYKYQEDHPEFKEEKKRLKEEVILGARKTIVNATKEDPKAAMDFMKRKKRDEFGDRQEIKQEINGNLSLTDVLNKAKDKE